MDVDVKTMAKKLLPTKLGAALPTPAAEAPATALTDSLKDPLAKAVPTPSVAPTTGQVPQLTGRSTPTSQLSPSAPKTAPTAGPATAGHSEEKSAGLSPGPHLASGEKVVRNLWLIGGRVPWGAVEQFMGDKVPKSVRETVDKQVAGTTFSQPFVELIQQGDGLALQIEDLEMVKVGPVSLKPDFFAPPSTAEGKEDEGEETDNDIIGEGRALVHDIGASVRDAERSTTALHATASELSVMKTELQTTQDGGAPSKSARAGARNLVADGDRRIQSLTTLLTTAQERFGAMKASLGSMAGTDAAPGAAAVLNEAEQLLTQLEQRVQAASTIAAQIHSDGEAMEARRG